MANETATETPITKGGTEDAPKSGEESGKEAIDGGKMTTAFTILLPTDGSSVIVDLGFESPQMTLERKASLDDAYRMMTDGLSQIQAMRQVSHHFGKVRLMAEAQQKAQLAGKA